MFPLFFSRSTMAALSTSMAVVAIACGLCLHVPKVGTSAESYVFHDFPRTYDIKLPEEAYDLDALAVAVARHETGNCTAKVGSALYNNCHGFRVNGKFLRFETKAESYAYFKDLWRRKYGRFPDIELARRYSGNDRPQQWLANVTRFYNEAL